jgi:thymidine kinase
MNIDILHSGSLHIITGGMKGRKTPQLIHYFDQLKYTSRNAQLFKPKCDYRPELHERYGLPENYLVSRTGMSFPATIIDDENPTDLLKKLDPQAQIIGLDEITLFKKSDELVFIILELIKSGKSIIGSGLDKNFRGEPFEPMPTLMAYATTVEKYFGICDVDGCNRMGEYPQRLIGGEPADYNSDIIMVGASESYENRCLKHHEVPGKK